jgi:hypothetical protein
LSLPAAADAEEESHDWTVPLELLSKAGGGEVRGGGGVRRADVALQRFLVTPGGEDAQTAALEERLAALEAKGDWACLNAR